MGRGALTGMTIKPSTAAIELARQLLGHEMAGTLGPAETGAALERSLARVSENLRRSVGDDGYNALLSRAIAQTQTEHPALKDIRNDGVDGFSVESLTAGAHAHDIHVISAALESLVASIVELLSGLIGADMVLNLLDPDGSSPESRRRGGSR